MRTKYNSKIQNIKNVGNMPGKLDAGTILKNSTGLTLSLSGGESILKGEWTEDLNEYIHGEYAPEILDSTIGVYKITDDRLKDSNGYWIDFNNGDNYFPLICGIKLKDFKIVFEHYLDYVIMYYFYQYCEVGAVTDEDLTEIRNDIFSLISDSPTMYAEQQPSFKGNFDIINDYFINEGFIDTADYPMTLNMLNGLASIDVLKKYDAIETNTKQAIFYAIMNNICVFNNVTAVESTDNERYIIIYYSSIPYWIPTAEVQIDWNYRYYNPLESYGDLLGVSTIYTQEYYPVGGSKSEYEVNAYVTYPKQGDEYWTDCIEEIIEE